MTAPPDIDWDYFGRRFLAYLKENRISFRQATKMCGTSHCTLHRCTHGKTPNAENFIRMMLFMGTTDLREI